jgi:hypothetical protein
VWSVVVALGLVAVVGVRAPAAGAQVPLTCPAEVDGARFDDEPDFAGRVRPFSGPDGTVVSRSLRCPYVADDGRRTELMLVWDEQPAGRFRCESDVITVEPGDPATAQLDHPDRQAAVLLQGPDAAAVRGMQDGARTMLGTVPDEAAACVEGASTTAVAPDGPSRLLPGALAAATVALGVLVAVFVRRRRSAPEPAVTVAAALDASADPDPRVGGDPGPADRLARHLLEQAGAAPLDALAAAAVIAHGRGRDDLAGAIVTARRFGRIDRGGADGDPVADPAARILEIAGRPADGTTPTGDRSVQ